MTNTISYQCQNCDHIDDYRTEIEEAADAGYEVDELKDQCPNCGEFVTFERAVEEL